MNEKLKEMLENGEITMEDIKAFSETPETEPTAEPEPVAEPEPTVEPEPKNDRVRQAELDRAMAKERKEKAELKRKLERLEKKILTDEEQRQDEFERQQQELEEQRRELTFEKNKMYAVKSMKKAEIGDTEEAMLLMEKLVMACADEAEIDDMVSLLKAWKDKDVTAEVNKRFKEGGHTPKKSNALNGGVNPYSKEQWNLTAQMALEVTNPELAAQLKAAAGAN